MLIDRFGNVSIAAGDLTLSAGFMNYGASAELTIASGIITATRTIHHVDTQADDATDNLDTINGGTNGDLLILRATSSARTIVLKDQVGNLDLAGDFSIDNSRDRIVLHYDGATWVELSRSDNAA